MAPGREARPQEWRQDGMAVGNFGSHQQTFSRLVLFLSGFSFSGGIVILRFPATFAATAAFTTARLLLLSLRAQSLGSLCSFLLALSADCFLLRAPRQPTDLRGPDAELLVFSLIRPPSHREACSSLSQIPYRRKRHYDREDSEHLTLF